MKIELVYLKGQAAAWAENINEEYASKISQFFKFQRCEIKSKSADRSEAQAKRTAEGQALCDHFEKGDFVILFDEGGKEFSSSKEFSQVLMKVLSGTNSKVCFVIGGPYGFSDTVRQRANMTMSLSRLTMNHHVAQLVALEQIYRGLTIWKGLPYHNQ